MLGMAAARQESRNSVHAGQPWLAAPINARKATIETMVAGVTTTDWPWRSTSREICGETTAFERAKVADTVPASQYSPRVWDSIATMPIGAIAIGRRAKKPASEKP